MKNKAKTKSKEYNLFCWWNDNLTRDERYQVQVSFVHCYGKGWIYTNVEDPGVVADNRATVLDHLQATDNYWKDRLKNPPTGASAKLDQIHRKVYYLTKQAKNGVYE